jgi:hypothetical protein
MDNLGDAIEKAVWSAIIAALLLGIGAGFGLAWLVRHIHHWTG